MRRPFELAVAFAAASPLVFAGATARAEAPAVEVRVEGDAVRPKKPRFETMGASTVVSGARLREPGATAADVLRAVPGVNVVEAGGYGAVSTAHIRGSTAAQTPVYLAGIRINDDVGGTADLSLIPMPMIDRIEIYRGHAPIQADRLGIGGAIFFEPRKARGTMVLAGSTIGSFGRRSTYGFSGVGTRKRNTLGFVRYEASKNDYPYTHDGGTRFDPTDDMRVSRANADVATVDAWVTHAEELSPRTKLDVIGAVLEREQGLPGLGLAASTRARGSLSRQLVGIRATSRCSTSRACAFESATSLIRTRSVYADPAGEIGLGSSRVDVLGARVGQSLALTTRMSRRARVRTSMQTAVEKLAIGPSSSGTHATRIFGRAATSGELRVLRHLGVGATAAGECNGTSSSSTETCSVFQPSLRAGAAYEHADWRVSSSIGRYARVPTLGELFGLSGAVRGSSDLRPETGIAADLGARKRWRGSERFGGAWAEIFGFARWTDDLIAYRRATIGYVRPFNVGTARVVGLESTLGVSPWRPIRAEIAATLLDPRDTSSESPTRGQLLPFRSRLVFAPRFEVEIPWGGSGRVWPNRATLAADFVYQSSRFADPSGLVVIPDQGVLGSTVSAAWLRGVLVSRLRASNLLDSSRFDLIGYPLPNRALFLSLEARTP